MKAEKSTPRRFAVAFVALLLAGCAQAIGIDDFTVADMGSASGGDGGSGNGSVSGSGSSSSGQPVDVCNEVHGCKRETATDFTGLPTTHVDFTINGYEPPCILVDASSTVTFDGKGYTFEDVPIEGGVLATPDPSSPIKNPDPANVMTASFPLGSACSYPYYSPLSNKTGAIFIK